MSDEQDQHYDAFKADMEAQKSTLSRRSKETVRAGDFFEQLRKKFKMSADDEAQSEAEIARRDEEARQALSAKWRAASFNKLCPDEFRADLDWSKCSALALLHREELQSVIDWQYGERGIYVVGASGLCKTRAVWVLLKRLIVEERREIKFYDGSKFGNEAVAAYAEPSKTEPWLESLARTPLLVVDDLGKRWTPAVEDAIFDIINRRTNWHRPTILTTNYAGDNLRTMSTARKDNGIGEARNIVDTIMRRVGDYFQVIDLTK